MKKFTVILIFFAWTLNLFGQSTQKEFAIQCTAMVELDSSENSKQMLKELMYLNKLTRGDAGESRNANEYLEQFRKFVYYFDSSYNDTTLMKIVERDYCPLISCYAFTALANNPDSTIDEQKLINLVLAFTQKTNSFVNLDWGCGSNEIETFDYLISVVSGFISDSYLPNLFKFQQSSIVTLLDARKKYYSGMDSYNRKQTWEEYSRQYLQH